MTEEVRSEEPGVLQRVKFALASRLGCLAIRMLGATVRWEVEGWQHHKDILDSGHRVIYTFWHGCILLATYFWRNRGIVVMTSRNRDGEYIARVIRRFGYGAARGSSSRGGRKALVEMIHELRNHRDVAFTIDGPRGPRYIAKPGAVWIASKSKGAVFPFHITPQHKWVLRSWDLFQIPKPFTRVIVLMAPPIYVREDAGAAELEEAQQRLQTSLDALRERGESRWSATGR